MRENQQRPSRTFNIPCDVLTLRERAVDGGFRWRFLPRSSRLFIEAFDHNRLSHVEARCWLLARTKLWRGKDKRLPRTWGGGGTDGPDENTYRTTARRSIRRRMLPSRTVPTGGSGGF